MSSYKKNSTHHELKPLSSEPQLSEPKLPEPKLPEHRARKRFGQNFLHDQNIIEKIVRSINPKTSQNIVEIGPGQGALTYPLLKTAGHLNAVEIDRDLIQILNQQSSEFGKLTIHEGDALKFNFNQLVQNTNKSDNNNKLRLVGNLPYNISTPIIFHLLEFIDIIGDMHFMLQKEVVQRMSAEPNSKTYGRLSVMLQWHCDVDYLFDIPATAFNPPPKVVSSLVRLTPKLSPLAELDNPVQFSSLVNKVFQQRRKTLRNILKNYLKEEQIQLLGISPTARPETLSLADFARLSNAIQTEIT